MAKHKGQSEKIQAEIPVEGQIPRISKEKMREYFRASPEAVAARAKRRARMDHLRREESASRKREEQMVLGPLEARLGIKPEGQLAEDLVMEADERELILATLEEAADADLVDVRDTYIYSLRYQGVFREKFNQWRRKYLGSQQLRAAGQFEDYALREGERYIRENRKLVIRSRITKFNKGNAAYAEKSEEEKKERDEKLYREIDMFIQANYEKLASYSTLDDKGKKLLFAKFWLLLQQNGVDVRRKKDADKLFELIVGDVEYEAITVQDYSLTSTEMMAAVNEGLTDEQWERRRQNALRRNAKGELKEVVQEQSSKPVYSNSSINVVPSSGYATIGEVARAGGVNFRPAVGKGENVYEVYFPYIREREARVYLRVVYPKGKEGKIDEATFILQDPYADKDAKKGRRIEQNAIEAVPTREVKAAEIPRAMNVLMLDYIMNRGIRTTEPVEGNPGINDIINDAEMVFMAERLFGFRLNDDKRHMTEEEIGMFKRFISIVIRDDKKTSLQERVRKVKYEVLIHDDLLPYFRQTLKSLGSITKTLNEVIEETKLRREGRFK